jgi:hypothetical protein
LTVDNPQHAHRQNTRAGGENDRKLRPQETQPLMHHDPALQQKGADLIDADALAD